MPLMRGLAAPLIAAVVAPVVVAITGCASGVPSPAAGVFDYGEGQVTAQKPAEGSCRISLSGRITPAFEHAFRQAFEQLQEQGCAHYRVSLNSGGGLIAPALRVGRLIRDNRMDTEIAAGSKTRCASACGFLFIAGTERMSKARLGDEAPSRELGFHQASRRVEGQKVCTTEENISPGLARQLRQYTHAMLAPEGAEAMMTLLMETDCRRMLYLDAASLRRLGITTR